ncbi:MAG: hypothetical protein HQ567_19095 [Candidatus Nealsonbacteria bacterium]|nr:hypothetical protein [Candidatus Nealsonbacteria bacterium]
MANSRTPGPIRLVPTSKDHAQRARPPGPVQTSHAAAGPARQASVIPAEIAAMAQGDSKALSAAGRLQQGRRGVLVEALMDEAGEPKRYHLGRQLLVKMNALSDKQLDALAALHEDDLHTGGLGSDAWYDLLDMGSSAGGKVFRDALLDLVGEIRDCVESGLASAVGRGLGGGGMDIQGTLGQLYAARTLRTRFPGARLRFEVMEVGREIDIQMLHNGRKIDVEVKTNLGAKPSVDKGQIGKDLFNHAADRWENMLYLYAPQQASRLGQVKNAMLRVLDQAAAAVKASKADPYQETLIKELKIHKMTIEDAKKILKQRFIRGLVGTYTC